MTYTGIVLSQSHNLYSVCLADQHTTLLTARVSGKMMHNAASPADYPAVGDHVDLVWDGHSASAVIQALQPRKSALGRIGDPVTCERQVIAANLDMLVMCMSLNQNFSLGRAERYVAAALAGNVSPLIILTKADLCPDAEARLALIRQDLPHVPVMLNDIATMPAVAFLRSLLQQEKVLGFAGSSGVGKSTLINAVLGQEIMHTAAIREYDGRGRHTTTHRELIFSPWGGAVIDTPGMRAFALDDADVSGVYVDLADLAAQCRFRNCTHTHEPGCAVRKGIEDGTIDPRQAARFLAMIEEEAARERKRKHFRR